MPQKSAIKIILFQYYKNEKSTDFFMGKKPQTISLTKYKTGNSVNHT